MALDFSEIPLRSSAPQTFHIVLSGVEYILRFTFQDVDEGGWLMDISLASTEEPLLWGAPLITGADLLAQFEYLNIQGVLAVYTPGDPDAVPTFTNLGDLSHLFFASTAVV